MMQKSGQGLFVSIREIKKKKKKRIKLDSSARPEKLFKRKVRKKIREEPLTISGRFGKLPVGRLNRPQLRRWDNGLQCLLLRDDAAAFFTCRLPDDSIMARALRALAVAACRLCLIAFAMVGAVHIITHPWSAIFTMAMT